MDRLDMALALIEEAKVEKKRFEEYENEYKLATVTDLENGGSWNEREKVWEKYTPIPKKSIVNDNLKMARRILVGEYM